MERIRLNSLLRFASTSCPALTRGSAQVASDDLPDADVFLLEP